MSLLRLLCQDAPLTLCDPCTYEPQPRGVGVGLCLRGVDVGGDFKLAPGRVGGGVNVWSLMLALKLVAFVRERVVRAVDHVLTASCA